MDIALQNFDVHAFRAAFQMVNFIISKKYLVKLFIYTLAISLDALYLITSFILMFNIVLKKGSGHSGLANQYTLFTLLHCISSSFI
jgi:hypothetical protein